MEIFDIDVPETVVWAAVPHAVEATCAEIGLQLSMKTSLKGHTGSAHWHYKRAGQTGTLEITASEFDSRIWLKVHPRRRGNWVPDAVAHLLRTISERLRGETSLSKAVGHAVAASGSDDGATAAVSVVDVGSTPGR